MQVQERRPHPVEATGVFAPLPERNLTAETCRYFHYRVEPIEDGQQVEVADYYDDKGVRVAQKVRQPGKRFTWRGDARAAGLFGRHRVNNEGGVLYVTEGEIDAMSLSQAFGHRQSVVSVRNGVSGAVKDLTQALDWLGRFREVVFVFDMDEAGQAAALACAELLAPGVARIAALPRKDANAMLVAKETQALLQAVLNPAVFRPDGIREAIELVDEILVPLKPGLAYPWPCLDRLTHGQRPAEMVTWTAGTGIGKSQVLREVVYHLHQTHGLPVGIIALEESARHSAQALLSLDLGVPLHIPERRAAVSDEDIRTSAAQVLRGVYLYDHFGSVEANSILPKIRYMVKAFGVRFVVLDHLSIMVSGYATDGDERKRIDEIVTRLRSLVQELDIGVHLVSHLRKASGTPFEEGGQISLVDLRGSGAIAQVSDLVVGLERNQQSEVERHVTAVRVLKNRFSGETGTAGWLRFDTASGRMVECDKPNGDDAVAFSPLEGEV